MKGLFKKSYLLPFYFFLSGCAFIFSVFFFHLTIVSAQTPPPLPSILFPGQQIWNNGVSSFIFGSNMTQEWGNDNQQTDPKHIIQSSMKNAHMQLQRVFIFHYSLNDGSRSSIGSESSAAPNALQLLGSTNPHEFDQPTTSANEASVTGITGYQIETRIKTVENMGMTPLCTLKDFLTDPTNNTDPNTAHKRITDPDTGQLETDFDFDRKVVAYLGNRCNIYEIGNEPDLDSPKIDVTTYVNRWIELVRALKQINPNAKFIGPVTYDDQGNYCWYSTANGAKPFPETQSGDCFMQNFMHGVVDANDPSVLPDGISFHWYTDTYCGASSPGSSCTQANITATYTNVINEVRGWVNNDIVKAEKNQFGINVPMPLLGITEWNANPGSPQYMVTDSTFSQNWTTWALTGMINGHLDFGNQFDTQDDGGYCYLDMFNSCNGTDQPTGMFTGMKNMIIQYMPNISPTPPPLTSTSVPTTTPTPVILNGDTNNDGKVDSTDIKNVLTNWLKLLTGSIDQYGDGVINALDFTVVAKNIAVQPLSVTPSGVSPTLTNTPIPTQTVPTLTISPTGVTTTFTTLPPGSALPSEATCASEVRRSSFEPRPDNTTANNTNVYTSGGRLTGSYLAQYGYESRVTGNFTGTTDEIIQWASCKWGFNEDITRAVAVQESYWHQSTLGDCGVTTQPETGGCASVGIMQVKGADIPPTHPGTWPYAWQSTAFNLDYALAVKRACFEGKETWLGSSYTAGDEWGCVGRWYSGDWYSTAATTYINQVKTILNNKPWLQPNF